MRILIRSGDVAYLNMMSANDTIYGERSSDVGVDVLVGGRTPWAFHWGIGVVLIAFPFWFYTRSVTDLAEA
jgi:hypothetical protein